MGKNESKKQLVTTDKRFSGLHNDPRFNLPKRNDFKVEIDDRFKKSDLVIGKKKAKVDRYGRKITEDEADAVKGFDKYYKAKEESASEHSSEESGEESSAESSAESSKEEKVELAGARSGESSDEDSSSSGPEDVVGDLARGKAVRDDYESSSDESSSDEEDSEIEEESDLEIEEEKPPEGEPSSTFAVVNLDWDHVKSTDLMATFQSFVPSSGHIVSVSIYPSQYGKERMQQEELEGPSRELFKKKKKSSEKEESDSDSDSEVEAKDLYEEADATKDYDSKALRKYQLQRLRYYYAVVVCDSVQTAKNIYDNCDGTEYESTANFFDLRYVPEGMSFEDEPRDSCTKIPSNYKPSSFVTDALQHSKVKLTWDETPAERVQMSKKAFSQKEIDDMDFKAYLASDNSDDEDEEHHEDLKSKYKNLAGLSSKIGTKDLFGAQKGGDSDSDVDVEITFTPGLESAAGGAEAGAKAGTEAGTEAGAAEPEESTLDKLKRKAKERRHERKQKIKEMKKQALEKKKSEKKSGRKAGEESGKSRAELELLMLDEDKKPAQHFSMNELLKSEKEKKKKSKHRNAAKIIDDDFKPDLNDSRFDEIFTSHDFAIDPTQAQYKDTATMKQILEERNKRKSGAAAGDAVAQQTKRAKKQPRAAEDVRQLAEKIKRKHQKQ